LLELVRNHLPLLRERIEDVPLLANRFLRGFTMAYGRRSKELTPEAYAVLQEHRWLGDVRELRNLMERIVIMNPQVRVDARHLLLNNGSATLVARPVHGFAVQVAL
jgi:two-component system nitrogen regulation response regulator NtrX